jgi:hypothetical protein
VRLLLWLLIVSPYQPPDWCLPNSLSPATRADLQEVSAALELTDGRDRWCPSLRTEIHWHRKMWRQCRGLPSIRYAAYLPPHVYCKHVRRFWEQRADFLRCRAFFAGPWRGWKYRRMVREAEAVVCWWAAMERATSTGYGVRERRRALAAVMLP